MAEKKVDPRIPEIVRRKAQGQTFTSIAKDLDVSRKTIYNLRTSENYVRVVDEMFSSLMDDIDRFTASGVPTQELEGMKEKGRLLRSLLPSLSVIQHKADPDKMRDKTAEITKRRKTLSDLFHAIGLTSEQWRRVEDYVKEHHPEDDYE